MYYTILNLNILFHVCHFLHFSVSQAVYFDTKRQNFTVAQIQSICRQQYKWDSTTEIVFERVENIVGKGENAGKTDAFFLGLLKVRIVC